MKWTAVLVLVGACLAAAPASGGDSDELIAEARSALKSGNTDAALEAVRRALVANHDDPEAMIVKADVFEEMGRPSEAALILKQAEAAMIRNKFRGKATRKIAKRANKLGSERRKLLEARAEAVADLLAITREHKDAKGPAAQADAMASKIGDGSNAISARIIATTSKVFRDMDPVDAVAVLRSRMLGKSPHLAYREDGALVATIPQGDAQSYHPQVGVLGPDGDWVYEAVLEFTRKGHSGQAGLVFWMADGKRAESPFLCAMVKQSNLILHERTPSQRDISTMKLRSTKGDLTITAIARGGKLLLYLNGKKMATHKAAYPYRRNFGLWGEDATVIFKRVTIARIPK